MRFDHRSCVGLSGRGTYPFTLYALVLIAAGHSFISLPRFLYQLMSSLRATSMATPAAAISSGQLISIEIVSRKTLPAAARIAPPISVPRKLRELRAGIRRPG
jgi:hypothetical protein